MTVLAPATARAQGRGRTLPPIVTGQELILIVIIVTAGRREILVTLSVGSSSVTSRKMRG